MKKLLCLLSGCLTCIILIFAACNPKADASTATTADTHATDTATYALKTTYSSNLSMATDPANAQKVLQVWQAFENGRIMEMKSYFSDTVTYDDASGMHFHGPAGDLLAYAKKDIEGLDSMRFDISMWQSTHSNDRNEDWVNIWSTERRYPKKGVPDTVLMQENWKVKEGRVVYFNQYLAKLPK